MRYGQIMLWISATLGCVSVVSAQETEIPYKDHVVILLDASGSMRESLGKVQKMIAAKKALHAVLSQLPPSTHIGLLAFGKDVPGDGWLYPLGPREESKLAAAINMVSPNGGTPLGRFMQIAADKLLEVRKAEYGYGTYRLLIVTDGEAQDAKLVERYTPRAISRGLTIDVIGVGMAKDHTLATKVHSYRRANDPESLQRAIQEVFAEVDTADLNTTDGEDPFEIIAPLPDDMATQLIEALHASQKDAPLDDRRSSVDVDTTGGSGGSSANAATGGPGGASGSGGSSASDIVQSIIGACMLFAGVGFAMFVVAMIFLKGRAKRV